MERRRHGAAFDMRDPQISRVRRRKRGSNETFNGQLRKFIQKSHRLATLSDNELAMIQNQVNNRRRNRLGYKNLLEVFT